MNFDKKNIVNGLNEKGRTDVSNLLDICNKYDSTNIEIYLKEREDGKVKDYLYYDKDVLVGYLVLFPSYKLGQVLVTGLTHPDYRRQGIFSNLLNIVSSSKDEIKEIRFICDGKSVSGKAFLNNLNAKYDNSSYKMEYKDGINVIVDDKLTINHATLDDLDDLVKIGIEAFDTLDEEERPLVKGNIEDKERRLVVGRLNETIIGCVLAYLNDDVATIGDLAVKKDYRRKGFGKALLNYAIEDCKSLGINKLRLNVHTDNLNALNLYESCGFEVTNATDFYKLTL